MWYFIWSLLSCLMCDIFQFYVKLLVVKRLTLICKYDSSDLLYFPLVAPLCWGSRKKWPSANWGKNRILKPFKEIIEYNNNQILWYPLMAIRWHFNIHRNYKRHCSSNYPCVYQTEYQTLFYSMKESQFDQPSVDGLEGKDLVVITKEGWELRNDLFIWVNIKLNLLIHHQYAGAHDWWRGEYFNAVKTLMILI